MKIKTLTLFLSLFMCLSLTSIGFASWIILPYDVDKTVNGSFETDRVVNSDNIISVYTGEYSNGISPFKYFEYGFLDENDCISNYGNMAVYFSINIENLYYTFGENGKKLSYIDVMLKLNYYSVENFDIISNLYDDVIIINNYDNINFSPTGAVTKVDNESYHMSVINIDISELSDESSDESNIIFGVEYKTKEFLLGDSFNTNIYKNLDNIEFSFDIYVNGY